jgi:hypothetical protein
MPLVFFVDFGTSLAENKALYVERTNGMAEVTAFPRSLIPWQFQANSIEGKLSLTDDGNGNLSGNIDGNQQVIGFWNEAAQKVTFLLHLFPLYKPL